jgi:hypothetical protein
MGYEDASLPAPVIGLGILLLVWVLFTACIGICRCVSFGAEVGAVMVAVLVFVAPADEWVVNVGRPGEGRDEKAVPLDPRLDSRALIGRMSVAQDADEARASWSIARRLCRLAARYWLEGSPA